MNVNTWSKTPSAQNTCCFYGSSQKTSLPSFSKVMRRGFPSCDDGYENSITDNSRGLDLLDLRLDSPAVNLLKKDKNKFGHTFSKRHECETSGNGSSYASSFNSSFSTPREIAKLFSPDRKGRRYSNNKVKPNKPESKCNDASDHNNMKMIKTSLPKQTRDFHNDSKWCQRDAMPPGSKSRDVSNLDGELTDLSSSSKLSHCFVLNSKRCLSRKSTKFSKSRKRSTMSIRKEGKFEFHSGDYFRSPHSCKVPSGIKASLEGKPGHFPTASPAIHARPSTGETKERSAPTLESMGIGAGELDFINICTPQKMNIHDAMYHRVANFINPDISVFIGSAEFVCHKIVLQCYSEYFEDLKNHTEVVVEGVSKGAFIAIYNWMLAPDNEGLRFIQKNNILEVLIASKILIIKELENQCLAIIDSKEAFSELNAYLLFIDASRSYQTEIMELMVPRIQMFFLVLVSSQEFTALEVNDLCSILQSNYIIVHCELEVFLSAVKWLMSNWEERSKYLGAVMKCIRFGLMTPAQLVDIRKNPNSPEVIEIANDKTVQLLIEDGLAYSVENGLSGKTDHHTERCDLLKLKIPAHRNWAKNSKDYKSYGEFLNYLEEISKDPQSFYREIKKNSSKAGNNSSGNETDSTSESSDESYGSRTNRANVTVNASSKKPSLSDLLCKEKGKQRSNNLTFKDTEVPDPKHGKSKGRKKKSSPETWAQANLPASHTLSTREMVNKTSTKDKLAIIPTGPKKRVSLRERAAVVIQATYRGHVVRKGLRNILKHDVKDPKSLKRLTLDNMFLRVKDNHSDLDVAATDDDLPIILRKDQRRLKPKITLKRSSSTDSNESIISVKEGPGIRRMPLPVHHAKSIILIGGVNPTSKHPSGHEACHISRYSLESNSWDKIDKMPSPRYYHGSTLLKGKIYIVGGCNPENEDNNIPALFTENCSYEPISGCWSKEPELKTPRRSFGLVTLCNHLYAIGGQDRNDTILSSVERFDPIRGIWEEVAPLPEPSIGAAICVYKNLIWVVGGMNGSTSNVNVSKEVWCYDPRQDVWTRKPCLRYGRAFASLATYEDYLFLVGGVTSENGGIVSNDHIDVWDGDNGVWKLKGNIDLPRHGHSVAFIGSLMIIMGGVTNKNIRGLNQVDSICMITGSRSKQIAPLPSPLVGHSCVLLPAMND